MLIVADDLTGAADSAAPFALAGHRTRVLLSGVAADDSGVVAIDTHGRSMNESAAAAATYAAVRGSVPQPTLIKIDSTMRGNVRATVRAAVEARLDLDRPPRHIVVCPAFPALDRTVVDGRVHLNGEPLDRGDLRQIFSEIGVLADSFGGELIIADARVEQDMIDLVNNTGQFGPDTLWVGSAGIARALSVSAGAWTQVAGPESAPRRPVATRVLVVVGSRHSRNVAQIKELAESDLVISVDPRDPELANVLSPLIFEADALVLTGGFTARRVLELVGVGSLHLGGEVEIGVPWGVADQSTRPLPIVTKAGGFGEPSTLRRAVEFLTGS